MRTIYPLSVSVANTEPKDAYFGVVTWLVDNTTAVLRVSAPPLLPWIFNDFRLSPADYRGCILVDWDVRNRGDTTLALSSTFGNGGVVYSEPLNGIWKNKARTTELTMRV